MVRHTIEECNLAFIHHKPCGAAQDVVSGSQLQQHQPRTARRTAAESRGQHRADNEQRGLVVPSEGAVRVIRAAEWAIRQASVGRRSQPIKPLEVIYIVHKRIGSEDVFLLGELISETPYGTECHSRTLLTSVVSLFFKLRMHHLARLATRSFQCDSMSQKLSKAVLFTGP
ncbi:guanine nucleotide-binding protein G(I)/G(S)/G(O) subunit gamma-12a isoform X2 [Nothobranchius furzeri]|uniref:guanine nucleotide-binding protein G(I)/G(S)/G(O) subunit gamma-12a isoform X2 n=1 Tax=Nothobranchius furzeri TaxID=105023 RepID=UPI00390471A2